MCPSFAQIQMRQALDDTHKPEFSRNWVMKMNENIFFSFSNTFLHEMRKIEKKYKYQGFKIIPGKGGIINECNTVYLSL